MAEKQMQVLLDGVWYDVSPESLREKPAAKKFREVRYFVLFKDGSMTYYHLHRDEVRRRFAQCEDVAEVREVVIEWEVPR